MKKSKLSIGLVTSFIGALALTSCTTATVTKSKDSIVDFTSYNGKDEKIEINVDELYREIGESKEGTNLYYNAILEVLTRYEYKELSKRNNEDPDNPELKSYERIESDANDKIRAVVQTAKDNAKNNGTTYAEEWDKILKQNDVESKKDLKLKYVYELEKEALSDWYFKKYSESTDTTVGLREGYLGLDEDWNETKLATTNVDPVYPYHILHILVKLSADAEDYTRAKITEDEAKKLWDVVRHLVDQQYSFEETAKLSDDTSKDDFGDVGIMSTKTDFYNEFKLGIYAFDGLLSNINIQDDTNTAIYKAFGIDEDAEFVRETTQATGEIKAKVVDYVSSEMVGRVNNHLEGTKKNIPTVPFDVFRQIGEKAKDDKIATFTPEGSEANLPRNVLFNAFLNFRSPFVITNELLDETSVSLADDVNPQDDYIATKEYNFDNEDILALANNNFRGDRVDVGQTASAADPAVKVNKKVLCDTNGNVVIGVRSTAGIHFMVMRKSVFEATNTLVGKADTSLEDYYTTKTPFDEGYPTNKETFVNMKDSNDLSYYTERVNKIKDEVKSTNFDAAYDYRIYETLMDFEIDTTNHKKVSDIIHFSDEDAQGNSKIRSNIDKQVALLRETAHYSQIDKISNAWQEYLLQLVNQNDLRSDVGMYRKGFLPTVCAFKFSKGNEDLFREDGKCYVK